MPCKEFSLILYETRKNLNLTIKDKEFSFHFIIWYKGVIYLKIIIQLSNNVPLRKKIKKIYNDNNWVFILNFFLHTLLISILLL